jgi:hypothetical protein
MNNWNQPYNPSFGQWPTPAQPQFLQPWQYNAPVPYYQPRRQHSGVNSFLFFGSLWLASKATRNYLRAIEAEQRLEAMTPNPVPPSTNRPTRASSVIPDYHEAASSSSESQSEVGSSNSLVANNGARLSPGRQSASARIVGVDFADGMFLVGVDIAPGTYRCDGLPGSSTYWERLRTASGESQDRIANFCGPGQVYVTLRAGEFFRSERSGGWTRIWPNDETIEGTTHNVY